MYCKCYTLTPLHMSGALLLIFLPACSVEYNHESSAWQKQESLGLATKRILHQGMEFIATVRPDGKLVVEGDIIIYPGHYIDLDAKENQDGLGVKTNALSIKGHSYRWKNGIVHYIDPPLEAFPGDPDPNVFTAAQRQAILDAMDNIEKATPGISFEERTSGQSSYISFTNDNDDGCHSPVGRVGAGTINYPDWCLGSYSTQHELLHSLGLWHEHSRDDRGSAGVTINWANIQGCPQAASSHDDCGECQNSFSPDCCDGAIVPCPVTTSSVAHNFQAKTNAKKIGRYDFDSIMHYSAGGFINGRVTGGTTDTIIVPTGETIGNRTAFSTGDIEKINVLYPKLAKHDVFFSRTGMHDLCWYHGREKDIATEFSFSSPNANINAYANRSDYDGSFALQVDTNTVSNGLYNLVCSAKSPFWGQAYSYPNATHWKDSWKKGEKQTQRFVATFLDAGLIPILF